MSISTHQLKEKLQRTPLRLKTRNLKEPDLSHILTLQSEALKLFKTFFKEDCLSHIQSLARRVIDTPEVQLILQTFVNIFRNYTERE